MWSFLEFVPVGMVCYPRGAASSTSVALVYLDVLRMCNGRPRLIRMDSVVSVRLCVFRPCFACVGLSTASCRHDTRSFLRVCIHVIGGKCFDGFLSAVVCDCCRAHVDGAHWHLCTNSHALRVCCLVVAVWNRCASDMMMLS